MIYKIRLNRSVLFRIKSNIILLVIIKDFMPYGLFSANKDHSILRVVPEESDYQQLVIRADQDRFKRNIRP